jgi:preprotein translocase subunit YajC
MDILIRLFGIPPAYAQDAGGMGAIVQLLPLIAIFGVFYFILIRPQQKKQKEQRAMIDALSRGDKVVTGGGIVGTVIKVEPGKEEMFVEIAPNVRVTVLRSTVSAKIDPNAGKEAPKPANDAKPETAKAETEKQS